MNGLSARAATIELRLRQAPASGPAVAPLAADIRALCEQMALLAAVLDQPVLTCC
jgi:hypothetical protein